MSSSIAPFLLNGSVPVFKFGRRFVLWLHDRFIASPTDPRDDPEFANLLLDSALFVDEKKQGPVLTFFPSSWCNLGCPYCYSGRKEKINLNFDAARIAIDYLSKRGEAGCTINVVFHGGGEPTQNFDLVKAVVTYLTEQRIPHTRAIVTNGTASHEQYKWLLDHEFTIGVSIDGPPTIQDKQRPSRDGTPSSHRIETALRRQRDHKNFGNINVRVTLTTESVVQIRRILHYLHSLGITNVFLETMEDNEYTKATEFRFKKPTTSQMIWATRRAHRFAGRHNMRIGRGRFMASSPRNTGCVAVTGRSFVITPKNTISACYECTSDTGTLGDIFNIGYVDTRQGTLVLYEDKIDRLRQRNVHNLPSCTECFAKFICAGGCAVRGIRETGDLFGIFEDECILIRRTVEQVIELLWTESERSAKAVPSCSLGDTTSKL